MISKVVWITPLIGSEINRAVKFINWKIKMDLTTLNIGYVPMSENYQAPGDKRRFSYYAKSRNLKFEIADPSKKYDLVILSQNADLSIWCNYDRDGAKIIYDLIDSYLAIPRNEIKGSLRGLAKYASGKSKYLKLNHWKSIESMCSRADAVICSTDEQARFIEPFCNNVHQILDVHSYINKSNKNDYQADKIFNIVWEGQADNVFQFDLLRTVFSDLEKEHEIALHFVTDLSYQRFAGRYWKTYTADKVKGLCKRVYIYEWNEIMWSQIISSCDLAVIPVDLKNPLVRGKPENKLILFWRMAMPVITSATPAYVRAMNKAGLDMTCSTKDDWFVMLKRYILNERARKTAGLLGRKAAYEHYPEGEILSSWDNVLRSIL